MAAGDDLRWTVVYCFNIDKRDEHIDNEARQRDAGVVPMHIIRQWKMEFVVTMPSHHPVRARSVTHFETSCGSPHPKLLQRG